MKKKILAVVLAVLAALPLATLASAATIPAEPTVSASTVVYGCNGASNAAGIPAKNANDGLTETTPKGAWGGVAETDNGILSVVKDGGTIVSIGKGFVGIDYTFPATTTPVKITAKINGKDYREGSTLVSTDMDGNYIAGTQRGTLIIGDKKITVTFAGEYIIDDITLVSRTITANGGAPTMLVSDGAKLVIGANTTFGTVAEYRDGNVTPILEVAEGGYAYLHEVGFSGYAGKGTIVVDQALITSGKVTKATFAAFEGKVVTQDGADAFGGSSTPNNPSTGDATVIVALVAAISAVSAGAVLTLKKRENI